jgi:hypothetical protein
MVLYAILGIIPRRISRAPTRFLNTAFTDLEYDPAAHSWPLERHNDQAIGMIQTLERRRISGLTCLAPQPDTMAQK